ncbi:MAG TPA: hypothetical protein VIU34_19285 [Steroidobacter sp.]
MTLPPGRLDVIDAGEGTSRPVLEAPRRWRPGMALRVAIGFAAVALTVIVANISTQQSAREAREKVRELLVQHEPLVRATESLAAAVSMYERAVIDQSETSTIAQQPVKAAAQRMTDAASDYQEAASRFAELDSPVPAFSAELNSFLKSGDGLLRSSVTRRSRMRDYWTRFDTLETSLNAPHANAVRFAGAVFASKLVPPRACHRRARCSSSSPVRMRSAPDCSSTRPSWRSCTVSRGSIR